MSVIATTIEPDGVARIFFDSRAAEPDADDEARIALAIERAAAVAATDAKAGRLHQAA
jgi:hypothetical protein